MERKKKKTFSDASFFFFFTQTFAQTSELFFFVFPPRVSKEIQSVSQQIQNCLADPAGISANMKLLQKSLGRPLPFKVLILCLQKIRFSSDVQIPLK